MARRRTHNHYCATKGCKNVIATCDAPQDVDGSPSFCVDEEHYHWDICDECAEEQDARHAEDMRQNVEFLFGN